MPGSYNNENPARRTSVAQINASDTCMTCGTPARIEASLAFGGQRSIQLSYGRVGSR